MGIDFPKWVNKFAEQWEDKPIEYVDESGRWEKDADPLFSSISAAIQSREEISVTELQKISQWKLQGKRNDSNIIQNESSEVERQSRIALKASDDLKAIENLTQLSGVGFPSPQPYSQWVARPSMQSLTIALFEDLQLQTQDSNPGRIHHI